MRLHSLVLAVVGGTPFVALAYDEKVSGFARKAGLGEDIHWVDELEGEKVAESCQRVLAREGIKKAIASKRAELREAAEISSELAGELLKGTGARALFAGGGRIRKGWSSAQKAPVEKKGELRALMRIRPDWQERPGGDTVQMEETKRELEALGVEVEISGEDGVPTAEFDLVHAFNLGRPEDPLKHCVEAAEAGKPVALSTVYWDFEEFWEWGDTDYWDLPPPEEGWPVPKQSPPPSGIELRRRAMLDLQRRGVIESAAVYLPNGRGEAELLNRIYGMDLSRTVVVTNAVDPQFFEARPEGFIDKYGIKDFVLCAARVEKRKNQLALVAALRGTGIPLVIVGQANPPEYLELCRRYADENTLFIDRMTQEELASAYAAARTHALVGWFETPGLSSLEAAAAGCTIATTDRGTPREYLGEEVWYCDPLSVESVREAVLGAYEGRPSVRLRERIREEYNWRKASESTREGYRLALDLNEALMTEERWEAGLRAMRWQTEVLARLVADRRYEWEGEARRWREWGEAVERELKRMQDEYERVTSRRLYKMSEALAKSALGILRALGVKR